MRADGWRTTDASIKRPVNPSSFIVHASSLILHHSPRPATPHRVLPPPATPARRTVMPSSETFAWRQAASAAATC